MGGPQGFVPATRSNSPRYPPAHSDPHLPPYPARSEKDRFSDIRVKHMNARSTSPNRQPLSGRSADEGVLALPGNIVTRKARSPQNQEKRLRVRHAKPIIGELQTLSGASRTADSSRSMREDATGFWESPCLSAAS